ncbi:gastrula zinc finger protein XlCGF26.1-like [Pieris brassicae]|uniref:gastrula zinc finger protein XlCGF26.1-like n=1 Tax=Pieris brassicae TaxID=7116 RepID=UPI001E65E6A1|nr:gastrula zinc finger protein XlCGF26.1-like [Pieris brassicae]
MPEIDLNNVLCVSCLCIGRRLQRLSKSLNKFYMDALYEIPLSNVDCIDPVVCWECEAILKKCLSFREQVKDSYRILQTYTVENLNECLLSDVSRPPRLIVHSNDSVNINPFNEVKVEFETEILKTDTDYQLSDTDDLNNDEIQTVLCDIKNEFVSTEDEKDNLTMKNFTDIKDEKTDFDSLVKKRDIKHNDKRRLNRERDKGRSKVKADTTKYPTYKTLPRQVIHRKDQVQRTPELKPHKKRVPCGECDKTFSHRAGLMNHRITVHEAQNEFPCKVCKKVFRWKTSLKRHLEKHAANTQTPEAFCSLCGIGFGSVASLQRHLRNSLKHVTPDQLKFICDHCKRRFADKTKLRDHIEDKHLHRTYKCYICDKPSKNRVGLEQHIRNVHKGRPNNKMCHHCGKGFPTKVQLESHIRTHTGERPFICEYCPTTFSQQSNLYKHHRQVHQSIRIRKKKLPALKKNDHESTEDPVLPIAVIQYMALPDNVFTV